MTNASEEEDDVEGVTAVGPASHQWTTAFT